MLHLAYNGLESVALDITMPDDMMKYNVSLKRMAKDGKYETSGSVGPFAVKLTDDIKMSGSPSAYVLFTSDFLEKVLVQFSAEEKMAKFSIRNGEDHLCVDINYKYSSPSFSTIVTIKSNRIPGEELKMDVQFDDPSKQFQFLVTQNAAKTIDFSVSLPQGYVSTGNIVIKAKTSDPLPQIDGKIEVEYKLGDGQEATLTGVLNSKTVTLAVERQSGDGVDETKFRVETPVQDIKGSFKKEAGPKFDFKIEIGDTVLLMGEIDGMTDVALEFKSSAYNGELELQVTAGQIECEFELVDNLSGEKQFLNAKGIVDGNEAQFTLKSSIPGFENIKATGTGTATPNGQVWSLTGDVGSEGYSINAEYTVSSNSYSVSMKADYGSKYVSITADTSVENGQMTVSFETKSSEYQSFDVQVEGSSKDDGIELKTTMKSESNVVFDAHLLMENSDIQKGLIATVTTATETLVDLKGVVGWDGSRASLQAALALPALGIAKDTFKANFAFQPLEQSDDSTKFEVLGELVVMGTPRKVVLRYVESSVESTPTTIQHQTDIEVGLTAFGESYSIKMGTAETSKDLTRPGWIDRGYRFTNRYYLNDNELFIENRNDQILVKLKIAGNIDLKIIGARNTNLGLTEISSKLTPISHGMKLELNAASNSLFDGNIGSKIVIRDRAFGTSGIEVAATVDVDVNGISRKAAVSVEANQQGNIEVSYGNGTNNKVVLAVSR